MRTPFGWALAAASMALAASSMSLLEPLRQVIVMPQAPSSGVPNYHRKIRSSRYMPHQGKRECARRMAQKARGVPA